MDEKIGKKKRAIFVYLLKTIMLLKLYSGGCHQISHFA
jgi:hypothetical protein